MAPQPVKQLRSEAWVERLSPTLRADRVLMAALEYWQSSRSGAATPRCDAIDPLRIPRLVLPHVILVDVLGGRFRYRLVGTRMVEQWGEDFTGRYLDEITSGEYGAYITGLFRCSAETRAPVFGESTFRWDVGRVVWARRLMLPYGEPDAARIMCVQTFDANLPHRGASASLARPGSPGEVLNLD